MKNEVYKDEGYKLMRAAFEVYNEQGYGMAEEIYQESLEIELGMQAIPFQTKQELQCFYKGHELKKRYVPDLFVFGCLVVELKAVTQLLPEHELNSSTICGSPNSLLVTSSTSDTAAHSNGSDLFFRNTLLEKLAQISAD